MSFDIDLNGYDNIIVALSGGKDSVACLLFLLDQGVDPSRLECWHHCIDGDPEQKQHFMDWKCTIPYIKALCEHLQIPLFMSWRDGGFYEELMKKDCPSKGVYFEDENHELHYVPSKSKPATRGLFPQQSGSLRTRWCSSSLKIEVMGFALRHQERFLGKKTLVVTGERRQESPSRAKYDELQDHTCNTQSRTVHHWRPVIDWSTEEVWEIIRQHGIIPHPAYWLGFGRTSCMKCVFLNNNDWAKVQKIDLQGFDAIAEVEKQAGKSIARNGKFLEERVQGETVSIDTDWAERAVSEEEWIMPIYFPVEHWTLPAGATGDLKSGSW